MRYVRMPINLLERQDLSQIHGRRRGSQAEQIVATSGKFVTAISGPRTGCARKALTSDRLRKEAPAFSRRVSAEVAARDQRLVPPAELAMRGIKHDNLPQGSSKELWMIGNIAPAWQRREPTLKFGCKSYKAYKTFSAAISTRPATVWIVRRSRCTPGSLPYPRFNCMRIFSYTVSWFLRAAEGRATRIEEPSR